VQTLKEEIEKRSEVLGRNAVFQKEGEITRLPYYLNVQFVRFFWKSNSEGGNKAKILKVQAAPKLRTTTLIGLTARTNTTFRRSRSLLSSPWSLTCTISALRISR
jgi:hypothetical protein